jgi:hypothetical protein
MEKLKEAIETLKMAKIELANNGIVLTWEINAVNKEKETELYRIQKGITLN